MPGHPPLRVLHVFSSFGVGGPQVRFTKLAAHLGDRCHHSVVAMDGDYACKARLDPGLEIAYPAVAFRKGHTVANVLGFRQQLRTIRPDVIVTNNWGSIEWSVANAIPISRHIHIEDGFGPEERDTQIRRRVLTRRAVLRRSTVVVPSQTLRRIAIDTWRLPAGRVLYIPNGIDCARFAPRPSGTNRPGDRLVIGTVAALRPEKNLARLLHAFSYVAAQQPCDLVIAGDGPELPALQRLAGELGLRDQIHFTGHTDCPETQYQRFDIFALSSDTEQMPLSVIEAMAAGLPIAATNVGDVQHMVADENRGFVTALDSHSLATAMLALVSKRELREQVGLANQRKAKCCYDDRDMFRAYARLLGAPPIATSDETFPSLSGTQLTRSQHA